MTVFQLKRRRNHVVSSNLKLNIYLNTNLKRYLKKGVKDYCLCRYLYGKEHFYILILFQKLTNKNLVDRFNFSTYITGLRMV